MLVRAPFPALRRLSVASSTTGQMLNGTAEGGSNMNVHISTSGEGESEPSQASRWVKTGKWEKSDPVASSKFFTPDRYGSYFPVPNPVMVATKIIGTIGPRNSSPETIGAMIDAGLSVARLNFSHGSHEYFDSVIRTVREQSEKRNRSCAIMLDTKGPEIRTGKLKDGKPVRLTPGSTFTFHSDDAVLGDEAGVCSSYSRLPDAVVPGDIVLVDDGMLAFQVMQCSSQQGTVTCKVINEALLGENKGVNLPGCVVDLPAVTSKDVEDIKFGVEQEVDFIAHSFTRSASGITQVREIPGLMEKDIRIIAKVENQEGLDNIDSIVASADAIMVARGDLGVEIPLERVYRAQKTIISKCNAAGKPVITATQMLDSMVNNLRPTRAEATDVANAVLDGTDAVMLSAETAVGDFPVETIQVMSRILREAECDVDYRTLYQHMRSAVRPPISIAESTASSAVKTCWDIDASILLVVTESGQTAKMISKYRPNCPMIAVTKSDKVARSLMLSRSVWPYVTHSLNRESCIPRGIAKSKELALVKSGDRVVVVSGAVEGLRGSTNAMESFLCE